MDNRLIFLYHVATAITEWRDGVGYGIPGDGRPGVTA